MEVRNEFLRASGIISRFALRLRKHFAQITRRDANIPPRYRRRVTDTYCYYKRVIIARSYRLSIHRSSGGGGYGA